MVEEAARVVPGHDKGLCGINKRVDYAPYNFDFHTDECSVVPTRTRPQCLVYIFSQALAERDVAARRVVAVGPAEVPERPV